MTVAIACLFSAVVFVGSRNPDSLKNKKYVIIECTNNIAAFQLFKFMIINIIIKIILKEI